MRFKKAGVAFLAFILALDASAQLGVPVEDALLRTAYQAGNKLLIEAVNEGNTKVSTQLINSTEMLSRQQDAIQAQETELVRMQHIQAERRKNAERYSPHMGGKVMPGCTSTVLAKVYADGASLRGDIRKASNKSLSNHVERNRYLQKTESVSISNASTYLKRMQIINQHAQKSMASSGKGGGNVPLLDSNTSVSMVADADGLSDYSVLVDRFKYQINPFPAKVTSNFDDPNQDPSQRAMSSGALLRMDYLKRIGEIGNNVNERHAAVMSTDFLTYMFPPGGAGAEKRKEMIGERGLISYYGAMQVINRYRAMSPEWQTYTASNSASLDSKIADQNLMLAQMMMNDDAQISLLKDIAYLLVLQTAMQAHTFNPDVGTGAN